jgi:hypothetical protein
MFLLVSANVNSHAIDIRFGDTPAARIAKDVNLPGKEKTGQCLPFALALQKKFAAAGIASRVVIYGYETGGVPAVTTSGDILSQPAGTGRMRGSHAVVVYDDGGRIYVMDNQSWTPQWVQRAGAVQIAQQFSGIHCSVKMARVVNEGSTPRIPALASGAVRLAVR